jgi:hypothetical protein
VGILGPIPQSAVKPEFVGRFVIHESRWVRVAHVPRLLDRNEIEEADV